MISNQPKFLKNYLISDGCSIPYLLVAFKFTWYTTRKCILADDILAVVTLYSQLHMLWSLSHFNRPVTKSQAMIKDTQKVQESLP